MPPGGHLQHAVRRALGARLRGVRRRAVQHVVVERDLRVRPFALVLAEQPLTVRLEPERVGHDRVAVERERRLLRPVPPRVAEPQRRQHVQRRRLRPAIVDRDQHQQVLGAALRVLDHDVEVAILVEHAGLEQVELRFVASAAVVHELRVRERRLRVLVGPLHVRVRGRGVQVEPVLLRVLAVVALAVGEPEDALLEDRVRAVPQGEREAQPLLGVRHAREPVLAPPVGRRPRFVVRERVPRVTAGRIVLAHRAPLAFRQVRTPRLPRDSAGSGLFKSFMLWGHACAPCQTRA